MILPVKTATGEYNIYLQKAGINNVGELLNLNRKVLIVTDTGVPKKYSEIVAKQSYEPFIITVNEGEGSKSFETLSLILKKMVELGFTRSDCVVAVGGGVVGDLSGFAASTYMRGIDFYNIPTTVLSQLDSSIGGKTAINFEGLKNIIGAFYPPKAVIIDTDTLSTLPQRQISNGLAEAVKMSLTSDRELFDIFENGDISDNIDTIIEKSLMIKRYVVESDEKEQGLRKILNFGHTLAHAIESADNMENFYHGEAVAIGMLPMCDKIVRERLLKVLKKLDLPTEINFNSEDLIERMKHDKKMSGKDISVVYVTDIGTYEMKKLPFEEFSVKIREALN